MSTYTFTTVDDPSANWSVTHSNGYTSNGRTTASGINNAGQIVGSYTASNGNEYGFLYNGGTYTTIDDPLATNGTVRPASTTRDRSSGITPTAAAPTASFTAAASTRPSMIPWPRKALMRGASTTRARSLALTWTAAASSTAFCIATVSRSPSTILRPPAEARNRGASTARDRSSVPTTTATATIITSSTAVALSRLSPLLRSPAPGPPGQAVSTTKARSLDITTTTAANTASSTATAPGPPSTIRARASAPRLWASTTKARSSAVTPSLPSILSMVRYIPSKTTASSPLCRPRRRLPARRPT
jgi:probable HAF family extracellular repeat protein